MSELEDFHPAVPCVYKCFKEVDGEQVEDLKVVPCTRWTSFVEDLLNSTNEQIRDAQYLRDIREKFDFETELFRMWRFIEQNAKEESDDENEILAINAKIKAWDAQFNDMCRVVRYWLNSIHHEE